ncbi:acyltransferase family protein [Actinacidiphila sp. ITFR-21]|uniref:acyltransferase family protein n=1 Tax=Actinacidiphila sp. ITFR-21 TaxID=3075199 RepID=UPI002889CF24|nr:acyltransferase [Streptomyces sp. ITFR-21]WNI17265.1 acyltransferase [Streptomyces sp. ITFR-21]
MTSWRFSVIAALLVFLFHPLYEHPFADKGAAHVYNAIFGQGGWVGVGFFLVLSGFVLTWPARPTDTVGRFYRRRFLKVAPNHLVTYGAALVIFLVIGQTLGGWKTLPHLFLLHAWFPQFAIETSVNPVSWSLSVEALFSVSFPFLLRLVDRIRPGGHGPAGGPGLGRRGVRVSYPARLASGTCVVADYPSCSVERRCCAPPVGRTGSESHSTRRLICPRGGSAEADVRESSGKRQRGSGQASGG